MAGGRARAARDRRGRGRGTPPHGRAGVVLLVGVLLLALFPGAVAASADGEAGTHRILLVGDSITQGSTGDWTWRYRLSRHLAATASAPVDFVGPRDDLWDLRTDGPGNQEYADPDFDRDHAALWGQAMWQASLGVGEIVGRTAPDVVVAALGTNDLLWWGGQEALWPRLEAFVAEVRRGAPDAGVVVMTVPTESIRGAAAWNARLRAEAHTLGDDRMQVVVADTQGFVNAAHTWDTSHPNARGELHLAAAVADALHGLGIGGPAVRPLPVVALGPVRPAVLVASAGDGSALLRWEPPPGATSHRVWVAAPGAAWRVVATTQGSSWGLEALENGTSYSVRVQSAKGSALSPLFSESVTVTPRRAPPARVVDVRAAPADHGARLSWAPVPTATSYVVEARQVAGGHHAHALTVSATADAESGVRQRVVIDELRAGVPYALTVRALRRRTAGSASAEVLVTPAGPQPSRPRVWPRVGVGGQWSLAWPEDPVATAYEVRYRVADAPGWTVAEVPVGRWAASRRLAPATRARAQVRGWHQGVAGSWSEVVRVRAPVLAAVRSVTADRDGESVVVRGSRVRGAATYRLLVARRTGCAPGGWRTGMTVATARRVPAVRVHLSRAPKGRWAVLRAVRQRVPGRVRATSAVCVR